MHSNRYARRTFTRDKRKASADAGMMIPRLESLLDATDIMTHFETAREEQVHIHDKCRPDLIT